MTAGEREPVCTVHVGLPKTGTSTLQSHFFAGHSGLNYLGKYRVARGEKYDPGLESIIESILHGELDVLESEDAQAWASGWVRDSREQGKPLVLSNEGFISTGQEMRKRRVACFQTLFGPCRAIITLREPVELIESLYFQTMVNRRLPLGIRLQRHESIWLSIVDWLDGEWAKPDKGALANLDYAVSAQLLSDAFGRDNVGIFLMEQLREDPDEYYRSICRFLGIDEAEGARVASVAHENPRVARAQYEGFREASRSVLGGLVLRWGPRFLRDRLVRKIQTADGPSGLPEAPLPPDWIERIHQFTRPGNDALIREWNLPLDRYGYATS